MSNTQKDFYKKLLGKRGEKLVFEHLKKLGYKILEKNYRTPFGEADIIALKGDTVYFVEVKTRSSIKYGTPAQAVDYKKQKRYKDIALYYTQKNKLDELFISFLVAEVIEDEINLISEAF